MKLIGLLIAFQSEYFEVTIHKNFGLGGNWEPFLPRNDHWRFILQNVLLQLK